jgi:transketolase
MNYMQRQFAETTLDLLEKDDRVVLMFAGAGIVDQSNFENFKLRCPNRIIDMGIAEQAAIGVASGLSIGKKIPVFHTQSPFIVERAYEQLKIDFGYQKIGGNFVGLGGSLEFTFLGPTHNCPADVGVLKLIPNMQIVVPGTLPEFDSLFRQCYDNNLPTYYRLSRDINNVHHDVTFGKANLIKKGSKATIIAIGPMLQLALDVLGEEDITILYYTTIAPFDSETLQEHLTNSRILLFEPYFKGGIAEDIISSLIGESIKMNFIGIPKKFFTEYGLLSELTEEIGISHEQIRKKYLELLK